MSLKEEALRGIVWSFAQQFGTQIISFIVSLVLARILMPSDFGTIAVFGVFMNIGSVLIDGGLTNSLIRTQHPDDADFSTVFYFNLVTSILVYFLLVLVAPWIAIFFNMPELSRIIRVYALSLPIGAFSSVQQTLFTKKMDFKTQLKIQLPSLLIGGITGIILAYSGFRVWSLVIMALLQTLLSSLQFWFYSGWRPKKIFDKEKFRFHFDFGYKLALSGLINAIFQNIYTIVIGKIYTAAQLGYYNKANSMQQLPVINISSALNRVTYPLFSKIQEDNIQLRHVYSQIMKMVIFIITPLIVIMGVLGIPLFRFLFTEKWLPAVPYFRILCIAGVLYPIHSYNLNILKTKGRSDLFLKLEIIKKIITVLVLLLTFRLGIIGLLWGMVVTSFIALTINCHYSGKFLHYSIWDQFKDLLPSILLSLYTGSVLWLFDAHVMTDCEDFIRLFVGTILGIIIYIGTAFIFKFKELNFIKNTLHQIK
ncbi:lipopolysaccharide biosynthesis protein [Seramator thermalis]|uniref:lipopolysaccharide biosynthesis protein n=1 Tax=Seramator thermalis TaxID=2496270 RepID=UPI00101D4008|nr:lipopolysaccharide biosynthesis protein [Seramator thermalis]